jgi:hypothetical protein
MPKAGMGLQRTVRLSLLSCAAVLLIAPLCLHAGQESNSTTTNQELSLKEYETELQRCAEALKQPEEVAQLRKSLPASWRVRAGEASIEVPIAPIAAKLREIETHSDNSPKITHEVEQRLKAMSSAAAEMESAVERESTGAAKEKLQKILARREFRDASGPSQWDLWQEQLQRWIATHLFGLFRFLHISQTTGNVLAWSVMGLAFVALCYVVWKWLAGKVGKAQNATQEEKPKLVSDTRQWVQEAFNAAEGRNYREAIHCAYWASVAKLEDLNVLSRDRTRTPRESLRLLEQRPSEQSMLRDITGRFELIWYGYRPASAEDWAGAKEQLEKMGCLRASTAPTANS